MPSFSTQIKNSPHVEDLIRHALEEIRDDMKLNMGLKHRHASGKSARSLDIRTTAVSGALYGLQSFMAMETGRRGGKVPYKFWNIIAQWIVDKGIALTGTGTPERQLHTAAWLISKKIMNEGTRLHREHRKEDIFSESIRKNTLSLGDQILAKYGSDINYINTQYARN